MVLSKCNFQMKLLWIIFASFVVVIAMAGSFMLWWYANPSSKYIVPISINYVEEDGLWWTTLVRKVNRDEVRASWMTEIEVSQTDRECVASGEGLYKPVPTSSVTFPTEPVLIPCLEAEGIKFITVQHSVRLGPISLLPTIMRYQADHEAGWERLE